MHGSELHNSTMTNSTETHPLQVQKQHYFSEGYNHKARWITYFYQMRLLQDVHAKTVLEIGPGHGWMATILRSLGVDVKTADFDPELNPDYVAEVGNLPMEDGSFDVVCAFEVLEHLPFEEFQHNITEMARAAKSHVIISLPDHRRTLINFSLKLPFLPTVALFVKIPSLKKHVFDGQHYWEIGKRGYSPKAVRDKIRAAGLVLERSFVPADAPMNHYFVIRKR